jgi:hypothetical protein
MNKWVKGSLALTSSQGYLDKVADVYPATALPVRPLDGQTKEDIRALHRQSNLEGLLELLFKTTKEGHPFPIEHPYASIFRQKPELMKKNPLVLKRLGEIILSMPVEDVIRGSERPIDINRVMGQAFYNWLTTYFPAQGIPILSENQFENCKGRAFFDGRDAAIMEYASRRLGVKLERGRDFLYRCRDNFVIGEARFLSTSGGSQTRDLIETMEFIRKNKGKITGVGILDGIIWFDRSYVTRLSSLRDDEPALTVLLLGNFLKSLP